MNRGVDRGRRQGGDLLLDKQACAEGVEEQHLQGRRMKAGKWLHLTAPDPEPLKGTHT